MLLEEVNAHNEGTYDFFYLPIDFKNKCNVGYAFISFLELAHIIPFAKAFAGQKWKNFNSEKICAISFARIQGKAAMIARFQNSSLMEKDDAYRPLLFFSDGPERGTPEPFPLGTRYRQPPVGAGAGAGAAVPLPPPLSPIVSAPASTSAPASGSGSGSSSASSAQPSMTIQMQ